MSEKLVQFDTVVRSENGRGYLPSAWCAPLSDVWEGWIVFEPLESTEDHIRTGRETEQASRDDVRYWAEGLTNVFLEGALQRALNPLGRDRGDDVERRPDR